MEKEGENQKGEEQNKRKKPIVIGVPSYQEVIDASFVISAITNPLCTSRFLCRIINDCRTLVKEFEDTKLLHVSEKAILILMALLG